MFQRVVHCPYFVPLLSTVPWKMPRICQWIVVSFLGSVLQWFWHCLAPIAVPHILLATLVWLIQAYCHRWQHWHLYIGFNIHLFILKSCIFSCTVFFTRSLSLVYPSLPLPGGLTRIYSNGTYNFTNWHHIISFFLSSSPSLTPPSSFSLLYLGPFHPPFSLSVCL